MHPLQQAEIRASFINCSRSVAKNATLPTDFADLNWDDLDFLGWPDPKIPSRAYIVAPHDDRPVGILLRAADSTGPRRGSGLCALCHSARSGSDILLFAAAVAGAAGRQGNTVGTYACADLQCSIYARGLVKLPLTQPETLPPAERSERLRERLHGFVSRVLKG